jgi:hypothetical protein
MTALNTERQWLIEAANEDEAKDPLRLCNQLDDHSDEAA